jgi:hypothetical protein
MAQEQPLMDSLKALTLSSSIDTLKANTTGMDYLFYGIAVVEGFSLSRVKAPPKKKG